MSNIKGNGAHQPTGTARILVVEDELLVGLDIACMLEERGYEVVDVVDSGARALDTAARERPDLVLMDITIRGTMDGVQTAQAIHDRSGDVPVVFVTSYTEGPLRERAEATHPAGYVTKPFSPPELERAVRRALCRCHGTCTTPEPA
ncbi:MAG: response regulator [Alphaproteobacteria bacterium]